MPAIRTILVAIKNPDSKSHPSIAKAAQLAKGFGAKLVLFHAITDLVTTDSYLFADDLVNRLRRDRMADYQRRLEAIAAPLREQKLDVRVCAAWDFPAHEAIVRHARKHKADLIVAECHVGRRLAPWLLHLTDWELLRTSPVPVLLVKGGAAWEDVKVLAAIDPSHQFAKPAKLDSRILAAADTFTTALKGTLHVAHSYVAVPAGAVPMMGASGLLVSEIIQGTEARARQNLKAAVAGSRIPRSRQHLVQGVPLEAIPRLAQKLGCGLIVMGALSRSGLKRVLIGNTAERILNLLTADVLVVKPLEFKTRVMKRGRGVHLIASPAAAIGA
ncbi:MAG: universal stress protein [Gammaproteobacteria bacterium]